MKKILFIVIAALFMVAGTASSEVHSSGEGSKYSPAIPKVLGAAVTAYQDFESKLMLKGAGSSELGRHIYNIENYYIKAYMLNGSFIVEFLPMPLNGGSLRGGGAKYIVDAKSGEILDYLEYR